MYALKAGELSKKVNLATSEGLRRKKALNYLFLSMGVNVVLLGILIYIKIKLL